MSATRGTLKVRDGFGDSVELTAHRDAPGLRDVVAKIPDATFGRTIGRANAARLAACWNAFDGWSLERIVRAGRYFAAHNGDEVEQMLREGGV